MSQLFSLTNAGAQELIDELYALPQTELQVEADAAGADFRSWVKSHFELSQTQVQYLDQVDQRWIEDAAEESKYFLENRLPIVLFKEQPEEPEGEDRGKLLDLDKKKESNYSEEDGYASSETLTYSISYPSIS
ncbi:MAG: hypothetical protein V4541_09090 [Bacteroidota bacterium]